MCPFQKNQPPTAVNSKIDKLVLHATTGATYTLIDAVAVERLKVAVEVVVPSAGRNVLRTTPVVTVVAEEAEVTDGAEAATEQGRKIRATTFY